MKPGGRKQKPKRDSGAREPVGLERVEGETSAATDEEDIAIELPIEQNDFNAQTS